VSNEIRVGDVEVTWLGHAGFMFRYGGVVVYVDPYRISHGEKADLILVTHDHYDHCDPGSLSSIRKDGTVIIAPKGCKEKVQGVKEIKAGQLMESSGVEIRALPAYNRSKQFHPQGSGLGYVFSMGGKRFYHAGDTDSIPEMGTLGEVDLALLPVGGTYTMDAREAAEAAGKIGAGITIPMHWGGIVGTRKDAEEFRKLAKVRVEILD
jgi:L-ascorbate metabolism protein UlaG (beta-lactamase superfamily)